MNENMLGAMRKLLGAGLVSECICEGNSFSYTLTDKGRFLRKSLRSEGETEGLSPADMVNVAYGLHFGELPTEPVKVVTYKRILINGLVWSTPYVGVSPDLWRGLCLHCVAPFAATYYVDREHVFFCTNCGARGRFESKGILVRLAPPKEEDGEYRDRQGQEAQTGEGGQRPDGEVGGVGEGDGEEGDGSVGPYGADHPDSIRGPGDGDTGDADEDGFGGISNN